MLELIKWRRSLIWRRTVDDRCLMADRSTTFIKEYLNKEKAFSEIEKAFSLPGRFFFLATFAVKPLQEYTFCGKKKSRNSGTILSSF